MTRETTKSIINSTQQFLQGQTIVPHHHKLVIVVQGEVFKCICRLASGVLEDAREIQNKMCSVLPTDCIHSHSSKQLQTCNLFDFDCVIVNIFA